MDSAIGTFDDAEHEARLREENRRRMNAHDADDVARLETPPRRTNREIDCGDGEDDRPPHVMAGPVPSDDLQAP